VLVRKLLPSFPSSKRKAPSQSAPIRPSNERVTEHVSPLHLSMSCHVVSNKLLLNEIIDEMAGNGSDHIDEFEMGCTSEDTADEQRHDEDEDEDGDHDEDRNGNGDDGLHRHGLHHFNAENMELNGRDHYDADSAVLQYVNALGPRPHLAQSTPPPSVQSLFSTHTVPPRDHREDAYLVEVINSLEAPATSRSGEIDPECNHIPRDAASTKSAHTPVTEVTVPSKSTDRSASRQLVRSEVLRVNPMTHCDSIHRCDCIKRVMACLDFYANIAMDGDPEGGDHDEEDQKERDELIVEYLAKYPRFADDYHHILRYHTADTAAFEELHRKITKYIDCDLAHCACLFRSNRGPRFGLDVHAQFCVEFVDSVHLTLCHSFDLGFRVPAAADLDDDPQNGDDHDSDSISMDRRLSALKRYLAPKRRQFMASKGSEFMECNKFNHRFGEGLEAQFRGHPDSTYDAEDEYIENVEGIKCFYWPHYRGNGGRNACTPSLSMGECFVERKYNNLKHELLSNSQCQISKKQYELSHHKALRLMDTLYVKRLRAGTPSTSPRHSGSLRFDDEEREDGDGTISVQHVLAVVLYTDLAALAHRWRSSFFKLQWESHELFMARKREFWHWTKLLTESVERFGDARNDATFYTAVYGKVLLDSFGCNFNAPLSVSSELAVPVMMADHDRGHLLELRCSKYHPRSLRVKLLDVGFVSKFGFEQEALFMADSNDSSLRISSILSLSGPQPSDYRHFVRAIEVFLSAVTGGQLPVEHGPTTTDCEIVDNLIAHRIGASSGADFVGNGYPEYINDLFENMLIQQKAIRIDVAAVRSEYGDLAKYVLSDAVMDGDGNGNGNRGGPRGGNGDDGTKSIEMVAFRFLFGSLFKYCSELEVKMPARRSLVSRSTLNRLSAVIVEMNATNLRTIKLSNISNHCDEMAVKRFKMGLSKLDWDLAILPAANGADRRCDRDGHGSAIGGGMDEHRGQIFEYVLFRKERRNLTEKFKNMFISR